MIGYFLTYFITKRVLIGIIIIRRGCGVAKPISQLCLPKCRQYIKSLDVMFNKLVRIVFGIDINSVKNIRELKIKKIVINGIKTRLPKNVITESGSPQEIKMGNEMRVIYNCTNK